jgi:hypothetical protein
LSLECALVELTGWSLLDIDATDIESLIPFMFEYPKWKARQARPLAQRQEIYADDANWL